MNADTDMGTTKRTVLLVDDDQDFLDIMTMNFEKDGWDVTSAHDEREGP